MFATAAQQQLTDRPWSWARCPCSAATSSRGGVATLPPFPSPPPPPSTPPPTCGSRDPRLSMLKVISSLTRPPPPKKMLLIYLVGQEGRSGNPGNPPPTSWSPRPGWPAPGGSGSCRPGSGAPSSPLQEKDVVQKLRRWFSRKNKTELTFFFFKWHFLIFRRKNRNTFFKKN